MKKLIFCALFVLTACASAPDENAFSAEELYNLGYERMEKTEWSKAAATFEKVELEHPYSQWATKAKLMGAYAYYKDEKYDDAVLSLDRFIRYHPGNKDIAYAYYMKGLCYYDQIVGAEKDQDNTEKALDAFVTICRKKIIFQRSIAFQMLSKIIRQPRRLRRPCIVRSKFIQYWA